MLSATDTTSYSYSETDFADDFVVSSDCIVPERYSEPRPHPLHAAVTCVTAVIALSISPWTYTPDIRVGSQEIASRQTGAQNIASELPKTDVVRKLRELRLLSIDWNGPGTRPPDEAATEIAESVIASLPFDIPLPRTGTAGDGEVSIVWDLPGYFADIGVESDGLISYYVKDRAGEKHFGDGIVFDGSLPDDLLALLPR